MAAADDLDIAWQVLLTQVAPEPLPQPPAVAGEGDAPVEGDAPRSKETQGRACTRQGLATELGQSSTSVPQVVVSNRLLLAVFEYMTSCRAKPTSLSLADTRNPIRVPGSAEIPNSSHRMATSTE